MDRFDAVTAPDALAKLSLADTVKIDRRVECADCLAHETGECDYHFESFGRYRDDDSEAEDGFLAWGK